ncbi:MAG TPA: STAS domain-containing protein [Crinalium sp.]|jgi:anti-anti-sigma factor
MTATSETITVYAPKRLDSLTAPFLERDLEDKIQAGRLVVLDLTQTNFIDPSSADVLMKGLIKSKQRRARLSLKGVNPQVKLVLELAGILQHFRRK